MLEIEGYGAPGEYYPPSYAQVTKVTGADGPVHRRPGGLRRHRWPRPRAGLCGAGAGGFPPPPGRGGRRDAVTDIRYARSWFFGKKSPPATQVAVRALGQPEWVIEAIAVL